MTGASITEVARRLDAGESFLEISQSLLDASDAALLGMLAVPRLLDACVAEELTGNDAALARAVEVGAVAPTGSDTYRMEPAIRTYHLARAWGFPSAPKPELAEVSGPLAKHYRRRGDEVEALYHEFAADPTTAVAQFEDLFAAADAEFDLPRCRDLLEVVDERRGLLGEDYDERWDGLRAYVDARSLWIDDWYRTGRFLAPTGSQELVDELLAGGNGRALHLFARGGSGKTMHLRWLVARQCVPARIACARVDLDAVRIPAAIDEPWLVLLALAEQLNRQLRGAPFTALLKESAYDPSRFWLYLRDDPSATPSSGPPAGLQRDSIRAWFSRELQALAANERTLIILDTLEWALDPRWQNNGRAMLTAVLEDIAESYRTSPSVRVVLSGRLDLHEQIDGLETLFPQIRTHRLDGFTVEEAKDYLRNNRHIPTERHIEAAAQALTETVDGEDRVVPLKAALVAEVIEREPGIPPDEVVRYSRHDLLYLIKRVVERIDPMVRWVLRYGVVARSLDQRFLTGPMGPYLQEAMSRGVPDDDVSTDELPEAGRGLWSSSLIDTDGEIDFPRLWASLRSYAGEASWVSFDPVFGEDVLRFHPDVVEPMRRVLAGRGVVDRLHGSAAEWFEQRAVDEPSRAGRWLAEAVYHVIHRDGETAIDYWAELIRRHSAWDEAPIRLELGRELWSTDLSPQAVARGCLEYGWAAAQIAIGDGTELPPEAAEAIRQAGVLQSTATQGRLALATAAMLLLTDRLDAADSYIEAALACEEPVTDRTRVGLAFAERTAAAHPDHARMTLHRILELAPAGGAEWAAARLELSRLEAARDRTALARHHAEAALEAPGGRAAGALEQLAHTRLLDGHAQAALALITPLHEAADAVAASERAYIRAQAFIDTLEPSRALEELEALTAMISKETALPPPLRISIAARSAELGAEAWALCGGIDRALYELSGAADGWRRLDQPQDAERCHLRRATLQMRELGDLHAAEVELSGLRAGAGTPLPGPALELVTAELEARLDQPEAARTRVHGVLGMLSDARAAPRAVAGAALAGLVLSGSPADPELTLALCNALANVEVETRRLVLLAPLRRCENGALAADPHAPRLRGLVPSPAAVTAGLLPRDRDVLMLINADLDRALGGWAQDDLLAASALANDNFAAMCAWLQRAVDVSGPDPGFHDLLARFEDPRRYVATAGLALGAVAILGAELAAAHHDRETNRRLLEIARDELANERATMGRWQARLHEALADAAMRDGDPAEADRQRQLAEGVYVRLGDERSARRQGAGAIRADRLEAPPSNAALIHLRLDGEVFEASSTVDGRQQWVHRAEADTPPLYALRTPTTGIDQTSLLAPLIGQQLGQLVFGVLQPGPDSLPAGRDLALRIDDPTLAALPWELLYGPYGGPVADDPNTSCLYRVGPRDGLDSYDIRSLQMALRVTDPSIPVDGVLGEQTRMALARFQATAGIPSTGVADEETEVLLLSRIVARKVAVLRSSTGADAASSRNYRQSQIPIDTLYDNHGIAADVLETATISQLSKYFTTVPAAILHIEAGLLGTTGNAVLDLAAEWQTLESSALESDRFSATVLGEALRTTAAKPIVVLDPPAPRSRSELYRQLMLRNSFASELFARGSVRAVLGLGLASHRMHYELWQPIAEGLAAGTSLGSLVGSVRRIRDIEEDAELVFGGSALWARSPSVRPPW